MSFIFKNITHLLKYNRMASFINVLGLSVSFAVLIVVILQVRYDFTYNHSFEKADNIYQYTVYRVVDDTQNQWVNTSAGKELKEKCPEIKNFCTLSINRSNSQIDIHGENANIKQFEIVVAPASPGFLDVFTPTILYGNAPEALSADGKVMIPKSIAIKWFGQENAVGKTFYDHYSQKEYIVSAVYNDFPKNSTIQNACYTYLKDYDASEQNYFLYLELAENTSVPLQHKLNTKEFLGEEQIKYMEEHPESKIELQLHAFTDLHLYADGLRDGNIKTTLSLLAIGVLVLIIAFINLLNITMARIPARIKSLNTHKILGVNISVLRLGLALEGVFLAFISILLALFYLKFFSESAAAAFFQADITLLPNLAVITLAAVTLLGLVFLINLYPAIYAVSFKMDAALKGSFSLSSAGSRIRNILIVVQFVVAIVLMIVAGFIKVQQSYMQNYDWGIQKENIAYLPMRGLKTNYSVFANELKQNNTIIDYTASQFVPGYVGMGWARPFEGKMVNFSSWPVTPNFLPFFGVKIIGGNDFSQENPSGKEQIIFNQEFLKKYEFDNSIVGKEFECFDKGVIVGIIDDINFQSLKEPIRPMAFVVLNEGEKRLNFLFLKLSGNNLPQTIKDIETTWRKFSDEEFKLTFLDDRMNELYKNENNMASLIGLFALITVVIAIMGVYGLVTFNTRYKQREIAIRKVNGASVKEIIALLNRSLLIQLVIAYILAAPTAYYIIQKWIDQFAYKAAIPFWLFVGAGVLVLAVSVATVSWQSWKAATANPVKSIKTE